MNKRIFVLGALLLALCGCEATSTTDIQSTCFGPLRTGTCNVTIGTLEGGPYRYEMHNDAIWPGTDQVAMTARISVGTGTLHAWIEDANGQKIDVTVNPGQTKELKGNAHVWHLNSDSTFELYFEPLKEADPQRAEQIHAEISYAAP